jgi:hypothetical protein
MSSRFPMGVETMYRIPEDFSWDFTEVSPELAAPEFKIAYFPAQSTQRRKLPASSAL